MNNLCEVITSTQLNNMSMLSMPSMHKHENYMQMASYPELPYNKKIF